MIKGLAEMAILAVLRSRPRYGLELLEVLNGEAGLGLADGTIYPLLHRLGRAGMIEAEWKVETPNGRPRKYYALTGEGLSALERMLEEWRSLKAKLDVLTEGEER